MSIRNAVARFMKIDTTDAKRLIENGDVTVNGVTETDSTRRLVSGDAVRVTGARGIFYVPRYQD